MNLSENLKKIRKENNLSQEELAEKLGVSRQSVSKWESNSAYPEMDKLIQISNMFNIGIDELLNKDIGEVREEKQSKINFQKTIDGFLDFITKSVDMFINMKFRQKIKFIFEEIVIAFVLLGLFLLLGCIGSTVCYSLFGFLGFSIYSKIYDFFGAIFIIIYLAFSIVIMLHIFKTRYLDYYVIVDKEEVQIPEEISRKIENNFIQNKHEKIIIRDANHSISRFFSILIKAFLILIKINLALLLLGLAFILVCFVIGFILSFSIIKSGLFFFGICIGIVSSCLILILFMNLLFNFIINRKNKIKYVFVIFIGCLILLGSGIGLSLLGFSTFKIINDKSQKYEMVIPMNNDLVFNEIGRNKVKFVESSNDDLKIVVNYSKNCKIEYFYGDSNNSLLHFFLIDNTNSFDYIRKKVEEFNNKKIVDSDYFEITIYTSSENITKLEENYDNWVRRY